jgi:hypothetical protein
MRGVLACRARCKLTLIQRQKMQGELDAVSSARAMQCRLRASRRTFGTRHCGLRGVLEVTSASRFRGSVEQPNLGGIGLGRSVR